VTVIMAEIESNRIESNRVESSREASKIAITERQGRVDERSRIRANIYWRTKTDVRALAPRVAWQHPDRRRRDDEEQAATDLI